MAKQTDDAIRELKYVGFEVLGEKGQFKYLDAHYNHNDLTLEEAIFLVSRGYPNIILKTE